MNNHTILNL